MARIGRPGMSGQQKAELWRRWKAGESLSDISRALAKNPGSIHGVLASRGGLAPQERRRSARALTRGQREEISRGLVSGLTLRGISAGVGVSPSTISREVHRNGGRYPIPRGASRGPRAQAWSSAEALPPRDTTEGMSSRCRKARKELVAGADFGLAPQDLPWRRDYAHLSRNHLP